MDSECVSMTVKTHVHHFICDMDGKSFILMLFASRQKLVTVTDYHLQMGRDYQDNSQGLNLEVEANAIFFVRYVHLEPCVII